MVFFCLKIISEEIGKHNSVIKYEIENNFETKSETYLLSSQKAHEIHTNINKYSIKNAEFS